MNHVDSIGDICVREVIVAQPQESLATAARLMHSHGVGCLVICEQRGESRVPVGILTDRDIVRILVKQGGALAAHRIEHAMTRSPLTLHDTETLSSALEHMRTRAVRRAPVVGSDGALVGIIAVDDLVDVVATILSMLTRLVQRQLHPEPSVRRFTPRPRANETALDE